MKHKLKFPTYEYIKSFPLQNDDGEYIEYEFTLFTVYRSMYCRFTYNEDGNKGFYLDLMCDGYCDKFSIDCHKRFYRMNKKEYKLMCGHAEILYNEIMNNLLNSNEMESEEWKNE